MAITPQEFLSKNMRWIALVLFLLLLFKSIQSCNRGMGATITQKEYVHTIDSLQKKYSNLQSISGDTIKKLNYELSLERERAGEADKRANAVQSVAEKMRANTTVNVRGAEIDTIKRKK